MADVINLGKVKGEDGDPGPQGPPGADAPEDYAYSDAEVNSIDF